MQPAIRVYYICVAMDLILTPFSGEGSTSRLDAGIVSTGQHEDKGNKEEDLTSPLPSLFHHDSPSLLASIAG